MKKLLGYLALPFVFALPALDFALVMRMTYIASVPDLMSPFAAVLVGCVLGIIVCVVFIAGQGNTVIEIVVPSCILLVLLLVAYPVASELPAKRRANLQKRALKAKRQQQQLQPKHR